MFMALVHRQFGLDTTMELYMYTPILQSMENRRIGYDTLPGPVELNKWMKMNVTQTKVKNDYQFIVEVDGEVIDRVSNTQTQAFENVKIYISDPWFEAVLGYVRNVFIKGKV